ncbi:MAG: hypothetical protein RIS52_1693 [Pseudomonadota bacterium]
MGRVRIIACFSALSAGLALVPLAARAQAAAKPEAGASLDPESPLAILPDLGVEWPEPLPPQTDGSAAAAAPLDPVTERRYTVRMEGEGEVEDDAFVGRFLALSTLRQGENKPANIAQIDRRTREDKTLLSELLRSDGYFSATVESRVEPEKGTGKLIVIMLVKAGPLYRFSQVTVEGIDTRTPKGTAIRSAFSVDAHDPVNADDVSAAETALKTTLVQGGYPFADVGASDVEIDHDTRSATLVLKVNMGGEQRIGTVIVRGERPPFNADHVARLIRAQPGETFNQARVEDLRRAIMATGLVSGVKIEPVPSVTPGIVDIAVTMDAAPVHTIAAEAGFGTGQGLQAEVSWTHRNLIKPEGAVTLKGAAGTQEQSIGAYLRMGNFGKRDHVLNARLNLTNANRTAYDARTLDLSANIERQTNIIWQKKWTWSFGAEFLLTNERDITAVSSRRQTFLIAAVPLQLGYDGSNDLFDPTSGYRLSIRLTPEFSLQGGASGYVRTQFDGSTYIPLSERVVLAGRVRLGTLVGANALSVAPSRRFYAGGGSSVRGYGFQSIGPRDILNDPVGGRSLTEVAIEARVRLGDFSVVPFFDAGNIYTSELPQFSSFRYGAGVGLRYHSTFGPIRIDIGTPLNPQPGDSRIGVYVSLGQAF